MGQDFTPTAQGTTATIGAGHIATYSVSLSPGRGFSQAVSFACTGADELWNTRSCNELDGTGSKLFESIT